MSTHTKHLVLWNCPTVPQVTSMLHSPLLSQQTPSLGGRLVTLGRWGNWRESLVLDRAVGSGQKAEVSETVVSGSGLLGFSCCVTWGCDQRVLDLKRKKILKTSSIPMYFCLFIWFHLTQASGILLREYSLAQANWLVSSLRCTHANVAAFINKMRKRHLKRLWVEVKLVWMCWFSCSSFKEVLGWHKKKRKKKYRSAHILLCSQKERKQENYHPKLTHVLVTVKSNSTHPAKGTRTFVTLLIRKVYISFCVLAFRNQKYGHFCMWK